MSCNPEMFEVSDEIIAQSYSLREAAELLKIKESALRQWVRRSKVPYVRMQSGGRLLMTPAMIDVVECMFANGELDRPPEWRPAPFTSDDHERIVLVDDPAGELIVGFGSFEPGTFLDTLDDGHWPDGSVWRAEGGPAQDSLYQVKGLTLEKIAEYSRYERING